MPRTRPPYPPEFRREAVRLAASLPHRGAARAALFDYIEGFYNSHRRHAALGYPIAGCVREEVAGEGQNCLAVIPPRNRGNSTCNAPGNPDGANKNDANRCRHDSARSQQL